MNYHRDECGRCGTELVAFRQIYESGTFSGNVSGSVSGSMWTTNGLHSYRHNYNSPITVQNELALRCAPPEVPTLSGWTVAGGLSLLYTGTQIFVSPVLIRFASVFFLHQADAAVAVFVGVFAAWVGLAIVTGFFTRLRFHHLLTAMLCLPAGFVLGLFGLVRYFTIRSGYRERRAEWEQSQLCPRCLQPYFCYTALSD